MYNLEHDQIIEKITSHLSCLDLAIGCTEQLLQASKNREVNNVDFLAENRERIINILQAQQNKIEQELAETDPLIFTPELIEILKAWVHDITYGTAKITELDQEIVDHLCQEKDLTTQEIASTFDNKSKLKGYNLNKVR